MSASEPARPVTEDRSPGTPGSVLADFLRGALMGAADVVPGVSGGTVALIVGVYERLLIGIRAGAAAVLLALRADLTGARRRVGEVDWWMLVPLAAGIAVAVVMGLRTVPDLLADHPTTARALLLGLVLASVQVPWRRLGERSVRTLSVLAVAGLVSFVLVGIPPATLTDPPLVYVFFAATISLCAMILPGVSGAFLLEAVGVYQPLGAAVDERDLVFLLTFALGGALGLALFAKLLEALLRRAPDVTMAALTGLLVGALRALWPWQADDRTPLAPEPGSVVTAVALVALGVLLVTALVRGGEWAERRRAAERLQR